MKLLSFRSSSFVILFSVSSLLLPVVPLSAQTLYVPGGANGIGSSWSVNVGIGTTNPGRKLEMAGTGSAEPILRLNRDANTDNGLVMFSTGGTEDWLTGERGGGDSNYHLYSYGLSADAVTVLRNIGYVGIGTINPSTKLHVAGGDISVDGDHGIRRAGDNWIVGYQSQFPAVVLGSGTTTDKVVINAGGSERIRIETNGNVGIGTSNPTQKLSVNGTIRAKEVIVDTGWSDYVFASDYALAPLSEVEAHIKAHHTLPGVPSEAQVAKEGISVGEMQAKLLAKIEELTLHQIAEEKRVAAVEAENAELRQKVESLSSGR